MLLSHARGATTPGRIPSRCTSTCQELACLGHDVTAVIMRLHCFQLLINLTPCHKWLHAFRLILYQPASIISRHSQHHQMQTKVMPMAEPLMSGGITTVVGVLAHQRTESARGIAAGREVKVKKGTGGMAGRCICGSFLSLIAER